MNVLIQRRMPVSYALSVPRSLWFARTHRLVLSFPDSLVQTFARSFFSFVSCLSALTLSYSLSFSSCPAGGIPPSIRVLDTSVKILSACERRTSPSMRDGATEEGNGEGEEVRVKTDRVRRILEKGKRKREFSSIR